MHYYVEDLIKQGILNDYLKFGYDDPRHKINMTTQHVVPTVKAPQSINLFALDKPPTKESTCTKKHNVKMINAVTKIDYNLVLLHKASRNEALPLAQKMLRRCSWAKQIIRLNLTICIFKQVPIDPTIDVSLKYLKALDEILLP